MRSHRTFTGALAVLCLVAACGSDDNDTTTSATQPVTTPAPVTEPATTDPVTTEPATTEPVTTDPVGLEQPAIWPAADVVLATPEEAATGFVTEVLGVPAELSEFRAGDSRSGEIEVILSEGGGDPVFRSLLLLRQLGPESGWFVTAAINEFVTITTPEHGATVPAGMVTVDGIARGFEATVAVEAYLAGSGELLDQQVLMAGNFDESLPYSTVLDLSAAQPGDIVVLLVRGTVGLETDPGEFSAIAVVIA